MSQTINAAIDDRSLEVRAAVREFIRVHEEWAEDSARPGIDARYVEAVEQLREVFEDAELPSSQRELSATLADLLDLWDEFLDVRDSRGKLEPSNRFYERREQLAAMMKAKPVKPLRRIEPVALLVANGVHPAQIARMYRFMDDDGQLLVNALDLVAQEAEKPGSVTQTPGAVGGRDWLHPEEWDALMRERRRGQVVADVVQKDRRAEKQAEEAAKPCEESPLDLFRMPGMSVKQAARMLKLPEASVAALFDRFTREDKMRREALLAAEERAQAEGDPADEVEDDANDEGEDDEGDDEATEVLDGEPEADEDPTPEAAATPEQSKRRRRRR